MNQQLAEIAGTEGARSNPIDTRRRGHILALIVEVIYKF
jgi:hypothetical protein